METSTLSVVLAVTLIGSYIGVGIIAIKSILLDGPAFERESSRFDMRIDMGEFIRVLSAKPSHIPEDTEAPTWEESEAYFPISLERRVPVTLGYKVEHLGDNHMYHEYSIN